MYGEAFDEAMKTWAGLAKTGGGGPGLQAAKRAASLAKQVGDLLAPYAKTQAGDPLASPVAYPAQSSFGNRLRTLAGLISKPLGIRVATVDAPGDFDTHANQRNSLNQSLPDISQSLAAFQADLEARGVADRVLTFVWSEFGRRPHDNDSGRARRRRPGLGTGHARPQRAAQRVPVTARVRRRRQPQGHGRLPHGLREPDRAVAPDGCRRRAAQRGGAGRIPLLR